MMKEMAKSYDPSIEDRIYQNWLDKGYFHAEVDKSKEPFTIVIPPPNITGHLHMGHALDETMLSDKAIYFITSIVVTLFEIVWIMSLEIAIVSLIINLVATGIYMYTNRNLLINIIMRILVVLIVLIIFLI